MAKKPSKKAKKPNAYFVLNERMIYRAHISMKRKKRGAPPYTRGPQSVITVQPAYLEGAMLPLAAIVVRYREDPEPEAAKPVSPKKRKGPKLKLVK